VIEGPATSDGKIKEQVDKEVECATSAFYTLGRCDDIGRLTTTSPRDWRAMIGWHGASMLCYVTRKSTSACRIRKT